MLNKPTDLFDLRDEVISLTPDCTARKIVLQQIDNERVRRVTIYAELRRQIDVLSKENTDAQQ